MYPDPPRDEPAFHPPLESRPLPLQDRRGSMGTVIAWVVIVVTAMGMLFAHHLDAQVANPSNSDPLGVSLMRIQGMYLVGAAEMTRQWAPGQSASIYPSARMSLNVGSLEQRFRFVILAAELAGPVEADIELQELEDLIERPNRGPPPNLTEDQHRTLDILHELYEDSVATEDDALLSRIDSLAGEDRAFLTDHLGWFGRLALHPEGANDREAVAGSARWVTIGVVGAFGLGGLAALGGLVGLIIIVVLAARRRLSNGTTPTRTPHGIYAETFAVWMVLFVGLQFAAALIAGAASSTLALMGITLVAFFGSLVAVFWPCVRGIPFGQVRRDIGWILGRAGPAEPLIGIGGYFMALPLLAIGLGLTLVLILVQAAFSSPSDTFAPSGGPAHPIIAELASGDLKTILMVLALGSIAAPIIEETFFRGVLYRHLRDVSRAWGFVLSVGFSTLLSSFIFAAIHPQGFVAVPALMGLAVAFALMREWRGSVIPSMVMHGLSNAIVMSFVVWLFTRG